MFTKSFITYLPTRFALGNESIQQDREYFFSFKNGNDATAIECADMVGEWFYRHFSYNGRIHQFIFVPVPTSSWWTYRKRWGTFVARLLRNVKQCNRDLNGLFHINIEGARRPMHAGPHYVCEDLDTYTVKIDKEFFANKHVIVLDDLLTTGRSAKNFAKALTDAGAIVTGIVTVAKTVYSEAEHRPHTAIDYSYSGEEVTA